MLRNNPKVIVFFGEMGSGKSFAAEKLAKLLKLEAGAFYEGDNVLKLPILKDIQTKIINKQILVRSDIERIVNALIFEVEKRKKMHSKLIVAQALYFEKDRKMFNQNDTVFIWVSTPFLKHMIQLYFREREAYLKAAQSTGLVKQSMALLHGLKGIGYGLFNSFWFEKPAGYGFFNHCKSLFNSILGKEVQEPLNAYVITNKGDEASLLKELSALPFVANWMKTLEDEKENLFTAAIAKQSSALATAFPPRPLHVTESKSSSATRLSAESKSCLSKRIFLASIPEEGVVKDEHVDSIAELLNSASDFQP